MMLSPGISHVLHSLERLLSKLELASGDRSIMGTNTDVLSPAHIKGLIRDGRAIVIYKGNVLNLTKWLPRHPGGEKAVHHMIGRDASDEMDAYHSEDTAKTFTKWKIGTIDYPWENLQPPIAGALYSSNAITTDHKLLEAKLDESDTSGSEMELISTSSSSSSLNLDMTSKEKGLGFPAGRVIPKVPQDIHALSSENKDEIFPVRNSKVIVDPQQIIDNFDNELTQQDLADVPALDYKTQQHLREKYHELHQRVIRNGFYQCNYWNYVRELVKISSLVLYSLSFFKIGWLKTSAILMGFAWQQTTFIVHDAGHISITHNYQVDSTFGMTLASWFGGLSLGWWKRNHNVHHLITNDPVHDPDIQHLPFFAVSARLLGSVYSTYYEKYLYFDAFAKKMILIQDYLYYPILAFGRFNLYRLSWTHLLLGLGPRHGKAAWFRYYELAGLSFFFYWYFYLLVWKSIPNGWDRFSYVMISHIATMMVHVQITLSHFAMSTADLGPSESFPQRQIRTTMDVDCPEWFDFFHGGLQFQAIHHLFPRLPRHNFRAVQPFVIDFCKDVGLSYSIYGFGKGNEKVISKLGEIAKQCSIMLDATKKLKEHDH